MDSGQSVFADRHSTILILTLVSYVVLSFSHVVSAQPYTFEEVASGLTHHDAGTRLRAIQILKDADYAEAVRPIAAAVADSDDRVQLAAIEAERSLFTTRAVPRRKKVGFVVEVRTVAGGEAAAAGQLALKARAVPAELLTSLAVALRDGNPRVRTEAINLVSLIGPVTCSPRVRPEAVTTPCTDIGNALIDNINSRQPLIRRAAMQTLGQLQYASAVQALSDQLSYRQRGPDAIAALEGLAGIGHPTSVSVFEDLLASSNAQMRSLAVEGLARGENRHALPTLQQMGQREQSSSVLLALHYANVKLGEVDGSLQQLIGSLRDTSLRPIALRYLLDLSTSAAPGLATSLKDQSADVRRLIADVLGFSRHTPVIPLLEAATTDADPDVAAAAQQAIARLKLLEPPAGDGSAQARREAGPEAPAPKV
jgi:HEAT repeat protein